MNLHRLTVVASLALLLPWRATPQISFVDDLQRAVIIPAPARRVVSLAPSITETLFAIGAGGQVVGVTDYCTFPPEAKTKTSVGGIVNPSMEAIVAAKPDLIVVSMEGNVRDDFARLQELGVPVFVTNPRTLEGIHKSIADLGALTGRIDSSATVVQMMRTREDSVVTHARVRMKKGVLLFVSLQPLIVVGGRTYLNELLGLAGAVNLAADAPSTYPTISREAVLADMPDVLLFMSDVVANPENLLKLYPEWRTLEAVQSNHIFFLDADIVSRPGPRAVDALESLYRTIHMGHQ